MSSENLDSIDQRLRVSVEALQEVRALIARSGDSILIGLHDIALTAAVSALTRSLRTEHGADGDAPMLH
jgi:hypothetical protein